MDSDEWISRDRGSEEQNFARCKPPPDKKFYMYSSQPAAVPLHQEMRTCAAGNEF